MRGYVLTPGVLVFPDAPEPRDVSVVLFVYRCETGNVHREPCGAFNTPEQAIEAREWFAEFGHPLPELHGVQ